MHMPQIGGGWYIPHKIFNRDAEKMQNFYKIWKSRIGLSSFVGYIGRWGYTQNLSNLRLRKMSVFTAYF